MWRPSRPNETGMRNTKWQRVVCMGMGSCAFTTAEQLTQELKEESLERKHVQSRRGLEVVVFFAVRQRRSLARKLRTVDLVPGNAGSRRKT